MKRELKKTELSEVVGGSKTRSTIGAIFTGVNVNIKCNEIAKAKKASVIASMKK